MNKYKFDQNAERFCCIPLESIDDARTLLMSLDCLRIILSTESGRRFLIYNKKFPGIMCLCFKTNCLPGKKNFILIRSRKR